MLEIKTTIPETAFEGLKVVKLATGEACEALLISLEKGAEFPEHTSPRDALLIVLEGAVDFSINNATFSLEKHHTFRFPRKVPHKVFSRENSKFLIIR